MKKILLVLILLIVTVPLKAHYIKFIAMDNYYNKSVPIDSILFHDINTGEDKLYLSDSIFFENISSVVESAKANNLKIYPNPVDDILNINLSNPTKSNLIISDITGRIQYSTTLLNRTNLSLNIAGLSPGVYFISSGDQSQTFVKNTISNGQVISLISTSFIQNSFIKENEIQSQYDYSFTIYCTGFKPNKYYCKYLTEDTTFKLDMARLTNKIEGKHIVIELFLDSIKHINIFDECHHYYTYDTNYFDFRKFIQDTLFLRGDSARIIRQWKSDANEDQYEFKYSKLIAFELNNEMNKLKNFNIIETKDTSYAEEKTTYNNSMIFNFNVKDDISFDFNADNPTQIYYLDKLDFGFKFYEKSRRSIFGNACESRISEDFYSNFNLPKSYIKIQIID